MQKKKKKNPISTMKKTKRNNSLLLMLTGAVFAFSSCQKNVNEVRDICPKMNNGQNSLVVAFASSNDADAEIVLTFNADDFIAQMDTLLQDRYGDDYVTENVAVYIYDSDSMVFPILQVSVVDVSEESSESLFVELTSVMQENSVCYAVSGESPQITCHSPDIAKCRLRPLGGKDLEACTVGKTKKGLLYCKECPFPLYGGICSQTTHGMVSLSDVMSVLNMVQ